jgi:hypothetical protein
MISTIYFFSWHREQIVPLAHLYFFCLHGLQAVVIFRRVLSLGILKKTNEKMGEIIKRRIGKKNRVDMKFFL